MGWDLDFRSDVYRHHESGVEISSQAFQAMSEEQRLDAVADMAFEKGKQMMSPTSWNASANTTQITFPTINTASGYPQQVYAVPKRWHNFPCGHQVELEPNQPVPMACSVCGPAKVQEFDHHTYAKCGHVYSFMKGMAIPPECPTCRTEAAAAEKLREEFEAQKAEERALREAEDREPLAWLDKQVGDLTAAGVI